jgi:hypothetical protein
MSDKPQITIHYFDGRESEVRDMTPEEIAELKPIGTMDGNTDETPTAD